MLVPIRAWVNSMEDIEENCLLQAINLASLPFAHHHIALMPDTHTGKGMPIGGVIACKNVVIPNAVGVDIGCGMEFVQTNIPVSLLRETLTGSGELIKMIIGNILRAVPVGFSRYKTPQPSAVLDRAQSEIGKYSADEELIGYIEESYLSVGTLGGGNHFIEIQQDEKGLACIMLHSGSRMFGNMIGQHFNRLAHSLNEKYFSSVPAEYNLPFLPVDTEEGQRYLSWMHLAMDFAYENRAVMLRKVKEIFAEHIEKYTGLHAEFSGEINCHHNYAALETHFGEEVWVHRKGAIHAQSGETAIIPGSMGSSSYIVKGLGNEDSFLTSSHGAGRSYSRTGAMERFSVQEVMNDLKNRNVVLGKNSKKDVAEECRFAYKDIDRVMENQRELTAPVKKLFTVGVVKG
ncbi:MAG: RtcB family protein [Ruminiclostridium sp.]